MRVTLAFLALGLLAPVLSAQDMEQKFEQKMDKAFVKNAEWITDYDEARKRAKDSSKLIFAYFTRSYAP